jgi:ribosome biogenesis GTPase
MSVALNRLGYSAFFEDQMKEFPNDFVPARVIGQHRREWDVSFEEGSTRAVLAGKRWDPEKGAEDADAQPTVGDWVVLRLGAGSLPVIEHILTRKTWLSRGIQGKKGDRQIIVSNIDQVAVVAAFSGKNSADSVQKRSLHPRRIERYLTAIKKGGAQAIVVLNKCDLAEAPDKEAERLRTRLKDYPIVCTSVKKEGGMDSLRSLLKIGQTVGFVGLSGVGKSSLVNNILGRSAQKVKSERENDARGRHTTTHRELFMTGEGILLIDTPGMREFAVGGATEADLEVFSDVMRLAQECQFRDCRHEREPGCRVLAAVQSKRLSFDRLDSFRILSQELSDAEQVRSRRKAPPRKRAAKPRPSSPWEDE